MPVGGYVIFDDVLDVGHDEVMQCWVDFKADNNLPEKLIQIDYSSAYFRKTVAISIDRTHMKPPRDSNLQ